MESKKIKIKDVKPGEIIWECPQCGKENHDLIYGTLDTKILQCAYCGHIWKVS